MELDDLKLPEMIKLAVGGLLILLAVIYLGTHLSAMLGRQTSNAVAFYKVVRPAAVNPLLPVSNNNPIDPSSKYATLTYKFADARGSVDVISFPNAPHRALAVRVRPPESRGPPAWVGQVAALSNSVDQALMYAQLHGAARMRRWLEDAHISQSQSGEIALDQQQFESSMAMLEQSEQLDLVDAELLGQLKHALAVFLKAPGTMVHSGLKRQSARKVMALARRYGAKIASKRMKIMLTYIHAIRGHLSDQEKSILTARIAPIMRRFK